MAYDKRIGKQERNAIKAARKQNRTLPTKEAQRYLTAIKQVREVESLGHRER